MEFETKALEGVLSSFGSKLIEKARANLNKKDKRAKGTLFNEMSYNIEKTPTGVKFVMDFGSAEDYWVFVDQGVQGAGGFKGSGRKRGQGSKFRFGSGKGPKGGLRRAIRRWIDIKGIKGRIQKDWKNSSGAGRFITKDSLVFLISRSIYQRGLERTRFITKPYDDMIGQLKTDLTVAMAEDIDSSITIEEQPKIEINLSK
tara:strand:+ start:1289 stop:1891 length:603 start_codon:yes stop_codon:yes gene_type:complete